jgi:hypothetical protein
VHWKLLTKRASVAATNIQQKEQKPRAKLAFPMTQWDHSDSIRLPLKLLLAYNDDGTRHNEPLLPCHGIVKQNLSCKDHCIQGFSFPI